MFSITYRFEDVEVALSADTIEGVLALDDAYNEEDDDGGWITWNGGECPVDANTNVDVRLRNGEEVSGAADHFVWGHVDATDDIVAYKVVKNA